MITPTQHRQSLATVRNALFVVLGVVVLVQVLAFTTNTKNMIATLFAALPFAAAVLVVFRRQSSCTGAALAGTIVFLMISANSVAPMYGTILEGNPVSYSLANPVEVFMHRAIYGGALLAAYLMAISSWMSPIRNVFVELGRMLGTSKLFSVRSVWIIGFIGIGAGLLKFLPLPNLVLKVLDGVAFISWAPYIILIPPYFSRKKRLSDYWPLGLLYLFQAGVSAGTNSRMGFIGPIAAIGSAWLVSLISGHLIVDGRWIRKAMVGAVAGFFLMAQLIDLSTAMVVERELRGQRSLGSQASETISTFFDKDKLERYRKYFRDVEEMQSGWKENYVDNPILARFIQIKYDDNCLKRVKHYTAEDTQQLTTISRDKILALIPGPFLKPLGITIDKDFVNSFSTGDLMETLGGNPSLGKRLTGSITIQVFAIFGWKYPLVIILIFLVIWIIITGVVSGKFSIFNGLSTLGLILAFQVFTDISVDGITDSAGFILRGAWETLFFYSLVVAGIRFAGEGKLLRPPNLPLKKTGNKRKRMGMEIRPRDSELTKDIT